jgi:hypothetical protein
MSQRVDVGWALGGWAGLVVDWCVKEEGWGTEW